MYTYVNFTQQGIAYLTIRYDSLLHKLLATAGSRREGSVSTGARSPSEMYSTSSNTEPIERGEEQGEEKCLFWSSYHTAAKVAIGHAKLCHVSFVRSFIRSFVVDLLGLSSPFAICIYLLCYVRGNGIAHFVWCIG